MTPRTNAQADEIFDVLGPQIQFLTPLSDADDGFCVVRGVLPRA
jgi:hypothetical protein